MANQRSELDAIAALLTHAGALKRLPRKGWIDRGVDQPESVAEHSYRLALMTLLVGIRDPGIDVCRAMTLALVHDLPEIITGDITPFDDRLDDTATDRNSLFRQAPEFSEQAGVAKTEAERAALSELTANLPDDLTRVLIDAWEEYEAGKSAEAMLVRQLDKLETWLQALEYRIEQPELIIESFRLGTERDITDTGLVALLEAINRRLRG
jgi:putative hydrolases of HD superfamily